MPWSLLIKGAIVVAIVGLLWGLWYRDREAYAARKVAELAASVKAEADRDWQAKLETALARTKAMADAADQAQAEAAQLKELLDEKDRLIASRDRLVAGLRATAVVARRSEIRSDPGSACHAQELRSERLAATIEDLQRSGIEVADGAAELQGLLLECNAGAERDAVTLRWWARTERAMRLGENPPPSP